jgi:hypothetical protein
MGICLTNIPEIGSSCFCVCILLCTLFIWNERVSTQHVDILIYYLKLHYMFWPLWSSSGGCTYRKATSELVRVCSYGSLIGLDPFQNVLINMYSTDLDVISEHTQYVHHWSGHCFRMCSIYPPLTFMLFQNVLNISSTDLDVISECAQYVHLKNTSYMQKEVLHVTLLTFAVLWGWVQYTWSLRKPHNKWSQGLMSEECGG